MSDSPETKPARQGHPQSPLFDIGQVVATAAVSNQLDRAWLASCLVRHQRGDWGRVDEHDHAANNVAVTNGSRILSVYPISEAVGSDADTIWVITDALAADNQRFATTFLYPHEY